MANAVTATTGTSLRPRIGPQPTHRLGAVDAGKLEVHEHEIRTALGSERNALLAGGRLDHVEPGIAQDIADELEVQLVVLDDQDPLTTRSSMLRSVAAAHRRRSAPTSRRPEPTRPAASSRRTA